MTDEQFLESDYKESLTNILNVSLFTTMLFISGKFLGIISWSWFWVFSPIILPCPIFCLIGSAILCFQWYVLTIEHIINYVKRECSQLRRFFKSRFDE